MKRKYIIILNIILFLLIASLITGVSFAFFSASVIGNDVASNNVITTGNMEITYNDGNTIGSNDNLIPGNSIEKKFSIKNTGDIDAYYSIYLNDVVNTFVTKEDLVCKLTREDNSVVFEDTCPSLNVSVASNISIGINEKHNYTLKITFLFLDRNQDDNKGKGFNARVDLVEEENKTKYIADQIIDLEKVNTGNLMYDGVDTLGELGTDDNNLRYVGSTPNNFVYYNCNTTDVNEMNDSTCEKWRIIGVFNNMEDENGNRSSRVKIMKATDLVGASWDVSLSDVNDGYGINQWGESVHSDGTPYEGADLMRELNTDYLGNITVYSVYNGWLSSSNDGVGARFPGSLSQSSIDMIQTVKWGVGFIQEGVNYNAREIYIAERSDYIGNLCSSGNLCTDDVVRTTSWIGKVGLFSVSDYVYAIGINHSDCTRITTDGDSGCYKKYDWLFTNQYQYTMIPSVSSSARNRISVVSSWNASVGQYNTDAAWLHIRPSLFLKDNVKIVGGEGSENSPYRITM